MFYRIMNFFIFIILLSVFSLLSEATNAQLTSPDPFCLPTCDTTDGRFLVISEGAFETFTPGVMNIQVIVPEGTEQFSVGIFDGDAPGVLDDGNWDLGGPTDFSYSLLIDPDQNNEGQIIFQTSATDLPNNDWADFTFNTSPEAQNAEGNFVYTLKISLLEDSLAFNGFKVRSTAPLSLDEPFGIAANVSSNQDGSIIYPNSNIEDGVQPEDYAVSTYDGSICLFFRVPFELDELTIWDADLDHGNQDGTDFDTDDPNSPNTIPGFVPPDSDAINEGANAPSPFDDKTVIDEFDPLNFIVRSPAVIYSVIFPDGRVFENLNPSGNREWERFVISSISDDPSLVDFSTEDPIPEGLYQLCLEGLDMQNLVAFRLPFPSISGTGEFPPTAQVPTMSEWGLITMAGILGLIGFIVIRKRATTYRI